MEIHWQFFRYALVGLASNGALYLAYLLLTGLEVGPKTAMTLLYVVGVMLTFGFNKKWSFKHDGETSSALLRYGTAYAFGYTINFSALLLLVDYAGLPHEAIQGIMILFLACMLFLLQKYWVFR